MPVGSDLAALVAGFFDGMTGPIGVAVSGGGDSVALLHLLAAVRRDLHVVTVDHGLRAESASEADGVARMCAVLGLPHQTLHWQDWDGQGNLMDAARRARQRLIAHWAKGLGIGLVALGHTADDQAETFVMRLARGSGVDGLAAMAARRTGYGVAWARPLLTVSRQDLRDYLRVQSIAWVDDPTNEDTSFDRIKARQALAVLAPLGITPERLADTVQSMSLAQQVLDHALRRVIAAAVRIEAGEVIIDRELLRQEPLETQLRLMSAAIRWASSADYRPRLEAAVAALAAIMAGQKRSLAGCLLTPGKRDIRITREPKAVANAVCVTTELWDNRWRVTGPHRAGLMVRALGSEGLRKCKNWRETGISRSALLVSPAIWRDEALIAAPLAGFGVDWSADIPAGFSSF